MVKIPTAIEAGFGQKTTNRRLSYQNIQGATADAFGAAQGRGLQAIGQGLEDVSDTMFVMQERDDIQEAKDKKKAYLDYENELLRGENGYNRKLGVDAVNSYQPTQDALNKNLESLVAESSSKRVGRLLEESLQGIRRTSNNDMNNRFYEQKKVSEEGTAQALANTYARTFIASEGNPVQSAESRAGYKSEMEGIADSKGLSGVAKTGFVNEKMYKNLTTPMVTNALMRDPVNGLDLLERPDIKKMTTEYGDYEELKQAGLTKLGNLETKNKQLRQLNLMNSGNKYIEQADTGMSGEEYSNIMNNPDISQDVKDVVSIKSGFSTSKTKLTPLQKSSRSMGLTSNIAMFLGNKDKTIKDVEKLNKAIDEEIKSGSITQSQATDYKNQVVTAKIGIMAGKLDTFEHWFDNGLGYGRINEYIESNTQGYVDTDTKAEARKRLAQDNVVADKVLTSYYVQLKAVADEKGMPIGELDSLPDEEIDPLLEVAYDNAVKNYQSSIYPQSQALKEGLITKVYANNGSLQGAGGDGSAKGDAIKSQDYTLLSRVVNGKEEYAIKNANGSIENIDRNKYKALGGKK